MKTKRGLVKDNRGFTGLEAAIVLTAFVVVAAVFAYMVLGAGFFSTEKAKAVVHTGVEKATSSAEVAGDVVIHSWAYNSSTVLTDWCDYVYYYYRNNKSHAKDSLNYTIVEFQVQLTAGQGAVDMDKVVVSYSDDEYYAASLPLVQYVNSSIGNLSMGSWNYSLATTTEQGKKNMLDPNEKHTVIVALPDWGIRESKQFKIDFKPAKGGSITIEKTTPGSLEQTALLT